MSTENVTVGGLTLTVQRRGTGPPVLLLGGLGNSRTLWAPVAERLPHLQTIAVDGPGIGLSSMPSRALSVVELADVYAALIPALGLRRANVVGYSFGGTIAQQLAIQHPEAVHRLVLCATTPGIGGVPPDASVLGHLSNPMTFASEEAFFGALESVVGSAPDEKAEQLRRDQLAQVLTPQGIQVVAHQMLALAGWSSLPWISRIRAPTLLIAGERDPLVPSSNAQILHRGIAGSRLHVVDDASHLLVIDVPDRVAGPIAKFVVADRRRAPSSFRCTTERAV